MAIADNKEEMYVKKSGNGIAIRIRKDMADDLHIKNYTKVSIEVVNGKLIVEPIKKKISLEELLNQVTDENRHDMTDWGESVGRERVNYPEAGDIIMLDLSPTKGNEQRGFRPCIVHSDTRFNNVLGLSVVAPITNQRKGYPFEENLLDGMSTTGVVLTDHLRSVDLKSRKFKIVEASPNSLLDECREYVFSFMGGDELG